MIPVKLTTEAVSRVTAPPQSSLVRFTFTPKALAVSSPPSSNRLNAHAWLINTGKDTAKKNSMIPISDHVTAVRLPKDQCTMAGSCCSFAINCMVEFKALNR